MFDSAAFYTSKWLEEHDEPRNSDYVGHDYVLTREERRRLHNQPYPVLEDSYDEAKPDAEGIHLPSGRKAPSESLEIAPRLNKRPRITPNVPDYDPHEWGMDVTLDLADLILPSEDSGVYMAEPGFPQLPDSDSMFAALAQDAEGLDGPHVPTEMFPDLDDRYLLSPRPDIDHIETYLQPVSEDDMLNYLVFSPHSSQLPQDIGIHDPPHDSCDRPVIETKLLSDPQIQEPDPVQEKPNPRLQSNVQDPPILELEKALLASGRQSLAAFLELRARKMSMDSLPREPTPSPDVQPERIIELSEPLPIKIPQEVVDRFTISLSVSVASTPTRHKYMASMDVMSKRDLLRCFSLPQYSIDLVERETLLGAHLILDPGTAVYLVPLMSLPSQLDEHLDTIGKLSWQFLNLLVIFESFLLSRYSSTIQAQSSHTTRPNPFSPPVIKSVRKLRRDLGISEAFQTTRSECMIQYAFALEVEEVATFVRFYGDSAEGKDMSGGLIWGDRAWLDVQEPDASIGHFNLWFYC